MESEVLESYPDQSFSAAGWELADHVQFVVTPEHCVMRLKTNRRARRLAVLLTANDQATVDHYFVPLTLSQPCRIIPQADLSNVVQSRPIPPPCANPRLTRAFDLLRW